MRQVANLLARIRDFRPTLSKAEDKVARVLLASPHRFIHDSITTLARAAEVSEPTVLRFCRTVGCGGFREFKVHLAQSLVAGVPYVHFHVGPEDSAGDLATQVFGSVADTLARVRERLDVAALERAIDALSRARRIEFYGVGASGVVAADAQHKFFRLGTPCVAYMDPHVQVMSAATLGAGDVVVAISHTGRTRDIIESARLARDAGATVIGITAAGSPLGRVCTLPLEVDVPEDTDIYTPMTSRMAHLAVIDVLEVGVALHGGEPTVERLRRMKDVLHDKRLPEEEPSDAAPR